MNNSQTKTFLFAAEGIGAVFVSVFLTVYWLGIRTGIVYHSDPIFRTVLSIFGGLFLIFILASVILYSLTRRGE